MIPENDIKKKKLEDAIPDAVKETYNLETEKEIRQEAIIELGFKHRVWILVLLVLSIISFVILLYYGVIKLEKGLVTYVIFIITIIFFMAAYIYSLYYQYLKDKKIKEKKKKKLEYFQVDRTIDKFPKRNVFDELSDLNVTHLNKYYKQTYDQCDKSFDLCTRANNISYILIIGGIILFFITFMIIPDEKLRILLTGISTGSGIIVKLVSSLYFYLYNKSVWKLNEYHDKLYTIQNILISLELSGKIEDNTKRDDIRAEMIRQLINKVNNISDKSEN